MDNIYSLVDFLTFGVMLNCLVTIPYCLQLAHGWTTLSFYKNLIAIAVLIPMMYFMIDKYGAKGGAIVWIVLNLGYCLFEIPVMHKFLLKGEMWEWYSRDVGLPLFVTLVLTLFFRTMMPEFQSTSFTLGWLFITTSATLIVTFLFLPKIRTKTESYIAL